MGRPSTIALVLVLITATAAGWLAWDQRADTFARGDGDVMVWDVWRRDVVAIRIQQAGVDAGLRRDADGGWQGGSSEDVDALLDAAEEARWGRHVADHPSDGMGFDAAVALTFRLSDGRTIRGRIGGHAPVGDRVYVQASEGPVIAVRSPLREALQPWLPDAPRGR